MNVNTHVDQLWTMWWKLGTRRMNAWSLYYVPWTGPAIFTAHRHRTGRLRNLACKTCATVVVYWRGQRDGVVNRRLRRRHVRARERSVHGYRWRGADDKRQCYSARSLVTETGPGTHYNVQTTKTARRQRWKKKNTIYRTKWYGFWIDDCILVGWCLWRQYYNKNLT